MMVDLSGKTALVTGGGQGVGRAIALVLAEQGADVAVGDIQAGLARRVAEEVRQYGRRALAVELDVAMRASAMAAVAQVVEEWGRIDILVNNAGVERGPESPDGVVDVAAEWRHVLGVNLLGVVNCTDAAMPHMAKARYGKIVNIASTAGQSGDPLPPGVQSPAPPGAPFPTGGSAYAASKAAVIRNAQIVAAGAARFNINVNTVCPSRMTTPMGLRIAAWLQSNRGGPVAEEDVAEQRRQAVLANNRFGRELEPEDIARAVAFLVSDDARNITGQAINVDGGFKMR